MKKLLILSLLLIFYAQYSSASDNIDKYFENIVTLPLSFDGVAASEGTVIPESEVYSHIVQLHNSSIPNANIIVNEWSAKCKFLYEDKWYYILEHTTTMNFVEWYLFMYPAESRFPIMLKIFDGEIGEAPGYSCCASIFFFIEDGFVNLFQQNQCELSPIIKCVFDLKNLQYLPEISDYGNW